MSINQYSYSGQGFFLTKDDKPFFEKVIKLINLHSQGEEILKDIGSNSESYQLFLLIEFLEEKTDLYSQYPSLSISAIANNDEEYDKVLVMVTGTQKKVFDKYDAPDELCYYIDDAPASSDEDVAKFLKHFGVDKKVRPLIWGYYS